MNRIIKAIAVFLICPLFIFSQSLGKERVDKLKRCVVRVFVKGDTSIGTGFFIFPNGTVLTCWHVIQPAFVLDSLLQPLDVKRIYIATTAGDTIEMSISGEYLKQSKENHSARAYDFCLLKPSPALKTKTDFLKLGKFEDIEEGDEVYTAGYPLGISKQFISKGTLSTKFIDTFRMEKDLINKSEALLDLTINRGNSGGPIIKIGATPADDRVIGIADFQVTRNAPVAEQLIKLLNDHKANINIPLGDGTSLSLTGIFKVFAEAIAYSSNGISGCVSINHFSQLLK